MKISFKNYKSFRELNEFKLKKFNILIGPNSSGKSSLAELVSYFVDINFRNTDFFKKDFNFDSYITNPNSLKGSNYVSRGDFDQPHAVFPRYYKMSSVENFKNITFDKNGVNSDSYSNNQKYFFGFKDYKKFSDIFPDKIHMNYKLKVRVNDYFRRADRRFRTSPGIPFNDFYTDKPLKDCDFYNFNQPELFSEFDDLLDTNIIKIIDRFSERLDSHLRQLENHPEKQRGITTHNINIKYGKFFTQYTVDSKEPFLKGLNIVKDKNSSETFMYHEDGSNIFNIIEKTISDLTKKVFESELNSIEDKFSVYKERLFKLFPKDTQYEYHLTMPLPIDKSKWDTSSIESIMNIVTGTTKENTVVNAVEIPMNLWNHSPYLNSFFYYSQSHNKDVINRILPFNRPSGGSWRRKGVLESVIGNKNGRRFFEENDRTIKNYYNDSPTSFFEWMNTNIVQRGRDRMLEHRFTDYDFYKDFSLTKQSLAPRTIVKNLNKDFFDPKNRNKAIQPGFGAFFELTKPKLRKSQTKDENEVEVINTIKRDLISDTSDIISFLNEVGYKKILKDFKLIKKTEPFGRIETWKFNGQHGLKYEHIKDLFIDSGKYNGMLCLSLYAQFFKKSILSSSISFQSDSNDKVRDASKKYGVSQAAIINQVDIIRMYLLRTSIVQFQKNAYRYLYNHYANMLSECVLMSLTLEDKITPDLTFGRRLNNQNKNKTFIIKPNTQQVLTSNETFIKEEDLIKFFGELNKDIFENTNIVDPDAVNSHIRLKNFINKCLDQLGIDFRVGLSNKMFRDGTYSKMYNFGIKHRMKSKKQDTFGDIVPINNVGMGNASIISILGSLYRFRDLNKNANYTIILREPETYLHPDWIEKLVRFLYDFIVGDNSKNLKLIIESHSETVLRTAQLIMKEKSSDFKDSIGIFFLMDKSDGKGSKILDLDIQEDGFLNQEIPNDFFRINSNLITGLWSDDEHS